ncbi:MAG: zinc ribbon domain-containing protein [Bryobacterales bacterium]|nr:zinc ribbon domain-containing protein [Bryobacterales bacterium]
MPIREFVCTECGTDFEKIVRASQAQDAIACPSCGSRELSKKLSGFAAHSGASRASAPAPMCPGGGMCGVEGVCGINRN